MDWIRIAGGLEESLDSRRVSRDETNQRGSYLSEQSSGYRVVKRLIDIVGSATFLAVLSPILVLTTLAIRLTSSGPAWFKQTRIGRDGKPFEMLKYRTMKPEADEQIHQTHSRDLASVERSSSEGRLLLRDDPRVTRVGRFLRSWSLDELPNLWNVLRGDMSLVGPRPLVSYELNLYEEKYLRRLTVPPGITGLAQIRGRLSMTFLERAQHDLEYVDSCSLKTDLVILARTVPTLLVSRGG